MSNFLTNIRINNLQSELDSALLAKGVINPLNANLQMNGNAITNVGELIVNTLKTNVLLTNPAFETISVNADVDIHEGNILNLNTESFLLSGATSSDQTTTLQTNLVNISGVDKFCLQVVSGLTPTEVGTVYDTVYNPPPTAIANPLPLFLSLPNGSFPNNNVTLTYDGIAYYWAPLFKVNITGITSYFTDFTLQADSLGLTVNSVDTGVFNFQIYLTTQPCSISKAGQPGFPIFISSQTFEGNYNSPIYVTVNQAILNTVVPNGLASNYFYICAASPLPPTNPSDEFDFTLSLFNANSELVQTNNTTGTFNPFP